MKILNKSSYLRCEYCIFSKHTLNLDRCPRDKYLIIFFARLFVLIIFKRRKKRERPTSAANLLRTADRPTPPLPSHLPSLSLSPLSHPPELRSPAASPMAAARGEPGPRPPPPSSSSSSSSSASEIHVRVNSRRGANAVHPVADVPAPPPVPAPVAPRPVVFREVKHFRSWVPWLVPTFVVANTVMLVITMYVNDCPKNSVSCIARFLGRFSFQPFKENPLLGPSSAT